MRKILNRNIIWLKNEINIQINDYSKYENDYAFGIVSGLKTALELIESMDTIGNSVKIQKRMDILQSQIDSLNRRIKE